MPVRDARLGHSAMSAQTRTLLRGIAFVAILGWIVGAPAYRHLLEGRNPHARAWMMFAGIGLGGIDVRFHVRGEDGTLVEVDRWEATGREMPERISARRIKNRKALDS